jgi:hypothetical protein
LGVAWKEGGIAACGGAHGVRRLIWPLVGESWIAYANEMHGWEFIAGIIWATVEVRPTNARVDLSVVR